MAIKTKQTIAKAIRVEQDSDSDKVYLVFEITNETFKKKIRKYWLQDVELELDGKELKENNADL